VSFHKLFVVKCIQAIMTNQTPVTELIQTDIRKVLLGGTYIPTFSQITSVSYSSTGKGKLPLGNTTSKILKCDMLRFSG
jgi:hypothetical protein